MEVVSAALTGGSSALEPGRSGMQAVGEVLKAVEPGSLLTVLSSSVMGQGVEGESQQAERGSRPHPARHRHGRARFALFLESGKMNVSPGIPGIKTDKRPLTPAILRGRGGGGGVSAIRDPSESFPYDEGGAGHSGPKSKGSGSVSPASQVHRCSGYEIYHFGTRGGAEASKKKRVVFLVLPQRWKEKACPSQREEYPGFSPSPWQEYPPLLNPSLGSKVPQQDMRYKS